MASSRLTHLASKGHYTSVSRRKAARRLRTDEVAEALAEGGTFYSIAQDMGISMHTVRHHFERICTFLGKQAQ